MCSSSTGSPDKPKDVWFITFLFLVFFSEAYGVNILSLLFLCEFFSWFGFVLFSLPLPLDSPHILNSLPVLLSPEGYKKAVYLQQTK